jgi:hypothetical protein
MREESPSALAPRRAWGRSKLVAATLALTMGALGAGLAATALPAYADVVSSTYTIGSPSPGVGGVTATPASVTAGGSTNFQVMFTAASAISGSSSSWINLTTSVPFASVPTNLALVANGCIQGTTAGTGGAGSVSTTGLLIYLSSTCNISAGSSVTLTFNAAAPASNFFFTVSTSSNASPSTSNTITVGSSASTLIAGSQAFGANTTYSISGLVVPTISGSSTSLLLQAIVSGGSGSISFATGGYSVTYTPSGGTATADPVNSVVANGSNVTLTLANPLAAGYTLNITATGTNPASSGTATSNYINVVVGSSAGVATNSILFGNSVTSATVSPSTLLASAPATYTISFRASSAVSVGGTINFSETAGPTNFATVNGVLVTDTTQNWHFVPTGSSLASGQVTIPLQTYAITAGDSLTVTLATVTNPAAQTVSDFKVSTSVDSVPTTAPAYTIGQNASPGVIVTPNPNSAGAIATYTISGIHASAAMSGGSSTIQLQAPTGTVFPNNAGFYSIADSTTSSGSGTVATITGGGTNVVTLTVPSSISSGDLLTVTIGSTINPGTASSAYTISLIGNVTGPGAVPPFPHATATYPNGAIISFGGTHYVFAGGRAIGISSTSLLASLQKVDKATILTAASGATAPTSVTPRPGTLMFTRPINGAATIYVVGTDGELHGFATPKQFSTDGYNGALVVTVTSLGGLKIGATAGAGGAADNALGTAADGAIILDGSAYYVFAGGRAFSITNGTQLSQIKKTNTAQFVKGTVTAAQKSAGIATGVVLSVAGPVYATYQGTLWAFKSQTMLANDGYSGTAAVSVPSTTGLTISTYGGS